MLLGGAGQITNTLLDGAGHVADVLLSRTRQVAHLIRGSAHHAPDPTGGLGATPGRLCGSLGTVDVVRAVVRLGSPAVRIVGSCTTSRGRHRPARMAPDSANQVYDSRAEVHGRFAGAARHLSRRARRLAGQMTG